MDDVRVHTNDIRMAYEYIRVAYGWHTSTMTYYAIQVHTSDIPLDTIDIRMIYE